MSDYIKIIGDCFPGSEAYVINNDDPTVYANINWITAPIDQASLDASICATGATAPSTVIHSLFPLVFNRENTAKNVWLSHEGSNSLASNQTPAIIPFDCQLVAMTFSNINDASDCDIELHLATDKTKSDRNKIHTWELRDSRTGRTTQFTSPVTFTADDKLSIYLRKKGKSPKYPIVILYFQILDADLVNNANDYIGN